MRLPVLIALVLALLFGGAYSQDFGVGAPREIFLEGRVTDLNGNPIGNAAVVLSSSPPGCLLMTMRTWKSGRFVFDFARNRSCELYISAPGFAPLVKPVKAGTASLELPDIVLTVGPDSAQSSTLLSNEPFVRAALPPDLLKRMRDDLADTGDCLKKEGLEFEQGFRTVRLRLGGGDTEQLIVEGLGPCLAGANNGRQIVYAKLGGSWRTVLDRWGSQITTLSSRTRGFLDLALYQHNSAFDGAEVVYRFDGDEYTATHCNVVISADPLTGKTYRTPRRQPCTWDWKASERPYSGRAPQSK